MYYYGGSGLLGLLLIILYIWAIISVLQSSIPPVNKLIWIIIILCIPFLGSILWFLIGSKRL